MKAARAITLAVFLASVAAVSSISPARNDEVGRPKGKVDVPTETLPPNQALRDLEARELAERRQAEADYIKAQRGSVFFAHVPLPAVDRTGQPVRDPKTDQQIMDGACLIWKRHWVYDNPNVPIADGAWYQGLSWKVNPQSGQVTVYQLWVPNGIATSDGFKPENGTAIIRVNIAVPLFDQPKPEWDCSNETWISVLSAEDRYIPPVVPWGVSNSDDPYGIKRREKVRQNCVANPQVYHNRC